MPDAPSLRRILASYLRVRPPEKLVVDAVVLGLIYYLGWILHSAYIGPPAPPTDLSEHGFFDRLLDFHTLIPMALSIARDAMIGIVAWAMFRLIADAVKEKEGT